jgi:hypothetical protein
VYLVLGLSMLASLMVHMKIANRDSVTCLERGVLARQ